MKDYYDFLIDKALEIKDFEWLKDILNEKQKSNQETVKPKEINDIQETFETSIVLEDIIDPYAIKESHGLRNIIFSSENDIINGNIVELKNYQYKDFIYCKQNKKVQYRPILNDELIIIRYYLIGRSQGTKFGFSLAKNNNLNADKFDKAMINYMKQYGINNN